ncbi:MAG: CADD family putative folate metabolism protein [Ignavibacteriae bacterium]|nr:CADD family putative folate metabolism protein [Ignavibacteria bacterium]MBI3365205.1 CADD family putative folate metabolism protein [Ignavibacteriota bacterium]
MNTRQSFLEELDAVVARNSMLGHPFYQTWTMGKLSREALREYAKQYYHFVQAFPTLISATHANTPHLSVRQELLENLIEEERGDGNHPGLWMKFAESLGVNEDEASHAPILPETKEAIETLRSVTRDGSYLEGVAALFAYESQIPEVARVKIEGLTKFYGVTSDRALSFFTVHQEADVYHSGSEKNILGRYATNEEDRQGCLTAAETSAHAMLRLLDGVYRVYVQPALN